MRGGLSALIAVVVLALPGSAFATTRVVVGDIAGDTGPELSVVFKATGKLNSKGKFVPRKVREFDLIVQFSCFDAAGNLISSTRRDDLVAGFFGALKVSKRGQFAGEAVTPTGLLYNVSGQIRKGKASGAISVRQGIKGADGYCSTGTFADPTLLFTAKVQRPVGSSLPPA